MIYHHCNYKLIFFLSFQRRQASKLFDTLLTCPEGTLCPIFHQEKRKAARDTATAAAITAATSDRRGTLAAVGLSLLWAAFSPGTIAMVARGIKHS